MADMQNDGVEVACRVVNDNKILSGHKRLKAGHMLDFTKYRLKDLSSLCRTLVDTTYLLRSIDQKTNSSIPRPSARFSWKRHPFMILSSPR